MSSIQSTASSLRAPGAGPTSVRQLGPPPALTERERQVLALIGRGYSNREISEELYLSINSIKTYIRSAYRKIGVLRRTQAVIWVVNDERARAEDVG